MTLEQAATELSTDAQTVETHFNGIHPNRAQGQIHVNKDDLIILAYILSL